MKRLRLVRSEQRRPHISRYSDAWVGETDAGYLRPGGDMGRARSEAQTSSYEMHELCGAHGRPGGHGQQHPTVQLKEGGASGFSPLTRTRNE